MKELYPYQQVVHQILMQVYQKLCNQQCVLTLFNQLILDFIKIYPRSLIVSDFPKSNKLQPDSKTKKM